MIGYRAVPYLVAAAPPIIVLLTVLIGGCTMTRTIEEPVAHARFYSEANSRAGDTLARELDRRAAREELRRIIEEARR
jgi:hypothetical protein